MIITPPFHLPPDQQLNVTVESSAMPIYLLLHCLITETERHSCKITKFCLIFYRINLLIHYILLFQPYLYSTSTREK
jgi:hypothetical protein